MDTIQNDTHTKEGTPWSIQEVSGSESKSQIVEKILNKLPDWFGIPESTADYVEKCASLPMWVAVALDEPIGFLALHQHNAYTAEICVMGILLEHHRKGIGKALFNQSYKWCKTNKVEFLQVKTLDESSGDVSYAKTREYYVSMGFKPFECMPLLWDEQNPCLIMVMSVK